MVAVLSNLDSCVRYKTPLSHTLPLISVDVLWLRAVVERVYLYRPDSQTTDLSRADDSCESLIIQTFVSSHAVPGSLPRGLSELDSPPGEPGGHFLSAAQPLDE